MWLTRMTLHSVIVTMLKVKAPRVRKKAIIIDLMVKKSFRMAKVKELKERKVKDNLLKVQKEEKESKAKPL
jgi:hypothetical protein